VREVIAALDPQGRWLTGGQIETRTFNQNLNLLSSFVE
jgi:hypothetical protein